MNSIIIIGNPVDGFTYVGPFDTPGDAADWANELGVDWWVAPLQPVPNT